MYLYLLTIIIVILLLFIVVSYFIKNDDTSIVIKPLGKGSSSFTFTRFNKGILTMMSVHNSHSLKGFLDENTINQITEMLPKESKTNVVKELPLIKPTKEQREFTNKYNKEQNKIMKADTEFQEKFMEDYRKMKNKEITIYDMMEKYKVDDSTIYRRGKKWGK